MSLRKITALGYPLARDFVIEDVSKVRNLVCWLEDQVICHYDPAKREPLRDISSSNWDAAFHSYLKDVNCPLDVTGTRNEELLDWLLGLGVRLTYSSDVKRFSRASKANVELEKSKTPEMVTANPLDKLDFSSPEFVQAVNALAEILEITKHPNHLVTLEAVVHYVKKRMSDEAIKNFELNAPTKKSSTLAFPIQEADLGFDSGDYVLNMASKILRLLYIHDLRDLQTKINECVAAVQNITANPKTDAALGQVGR